MGFAKRKPVGGKDPDVLYRFAPQLDRFLCPSVKTGTGYVSWTRAAVGLPSRLLNAGSKSGGRDSSCLWFVKPSRTTTQVDLSNTVLQFPSRYFFYGLLWNANGERKMLKFGSKVRIDCRFRKSGKARTIFLAYSTNWPLALMPLVEQM